MDGLGNSGTRSWQTWYVQSPARTSTSTIRTFLSFGETSKTQDDLAESKLNHFVQPDRFLLSTLTTVPSLILSRSVRLYSLL